MYVTAHIDRGDIDSSVTTTGNLNAVITVQVGSQVSGNIIALYADFNTKVRKGQLVAEIDPAQFKASVDQATATLNAAKTAVITTKATLAQSQANLARVENDRRQVVVKTGSTSQEVQTPRRPTMGRRRRFAGGRKRRAGIGRSFPGERSMWRAPSLDQASAVVAQDEAILAQAQLNLSHTRIVAPADGTVQSRNMDVGQTVAASFQAPVIFLIAQDLTKMQVDTNVMKPMQGRSASINRRATNANRNIYFKDGRIVRDEKVARPQEADHELMEFATPTRSDCLFHAHSSAGRHTHIAKQRLTLQNVNRSLLRLDD
jgi:HlyD family secretion protein